MGAERRARWVTLGAVTAVIAAALAADGDAFRLARATLWADRDAQLAAAALAAWSAALSVQHFARSLPIHAVPSAISTRAWRFAHRTAALAVGGLAAVLLVRSMQWGVRLDAPMVLYPARLFVTGERLPYRDIVEFNLPATYVIYGLMDRLIGSELGYRIVDAALMIGAGAASTVAFRLPTRWAAVIATSLFAFTHFYAGGVDCLQREMFIVALAMFVGALLVHRRWVVAGAVAAVCLWMKFHAVLLIAPFVWDAIRTSPSDELRRGLVRFVGVVAGASGLVLLSLVALGIFDAWREMVTEYLPFYGRMAGTWNFSSDATNLWTRRIWLFLQPTDHPAVLGLALVPALLLRRPPTSPAAPDPTRSLLGFYAGAIAYVLVQGTFWHYQSIPEMFAIGSICGFLICDAPERRGYAQLARVGLALAVAFHVAGPSTFDAMQWELSGRNDESVRMAERLREELPPGETVQPIETVTGALDAMWRADVPIATSFVFDIVFYYRSDAPVIARWRRRFLDELDRSRPYFLLEAVDGYMARPYGPGSDNEFPELHEWIRANYVEHRTEGSFRWWRRRDAR